jgi:protein kinase C substrate 80K-H
MAQEMPVILALLCLAALAVEGKGLRGVNPEYASQYSGSGGVFKCLDGSATIPFDRVNDNYCDCPGDGSDEPGGHQIIPQISIVFLRRC